VGCILDILPATFTCSNVIFHLIKGGSDISSLHLILNRAAIITSCKRQDLTFFCYDQAGCYENLIVSCNCSG